MPYLEALSFHICCIFTQFSAESWVLTKLCMQIGCFVCGWPDSPSGFSSPSFSLPFKIYPPASPTTSMFFLIAFCRLSLSCSPLLFFPRHTCVLRRTTPELDLTIRRCHFWELRHPSCHWREMIVRERLLTSVAGISHLALWCGSLTVLHSLIRFIFIRFLALTSFIFLHEKIKFLLNPTGSPIFPSVSKQQKSYKSV